MVRAPTKTCPSLYRLLVDAPAPLLAQFLKGKPFERSEWLAGYRFAPDDPGGRDRALRMLDKELKSTLLPLETEAARIVTISEPRGQFALEGLVRDEDEKSLIATFLAQEDELARSLWAWLDSTRLFEAAENILHVRLYRRYEKHYQTFQAAPANSDGRHVGELALKDFLADLEKELKRGPGCATERFGIPADGEEPEAEMYIIRHPNLPTAAQEIDDSGEVSKFYFRPPGEAMVVFVPSTGRLHVRADTRAIRHLVWKSFVTKALVQDPSHQPVDFRAYDISCFLTDLNLETPEDREAVVKEVWLIRLDASIGRLSNRLSISTTIGQSIRNLIDGQPGLDKVLARAVAIRFVEIAVRYRRAGLSEDQTLAFTISDGNTTSLMSVNDPFEQALGHRLLRAWRILTEGRAPAKADLRDVLPAILALWDTNADHVVGAWLASRNLDAKTLIDLGFLVAQGWDDTDLIDDEDGVGAQEANVDAGPTRIDLRLAVGQGATATTPEQYRRYRVRSDWVLQYLKSTISAQFGRKEVEVITSNLFTLGELQVSDKRVPVYLVRQLGDERLQAETDSALRALSDRGIGLVLDAGRRAGYTLAANVRLSLAEYMGTNAPEHVVDRENLQMAFARHRNLAAGGESVELTMTGENSGTLSVPGRGTIEIIGKNRLVVIRRLVEAHRSRAGAQKTEDMIKGFGEQSLSNIFGSVLWKKLRGGFLRSTGKGKWEIAA
jgi:hypothetical protein